MRGTINGEKMTGATEDMMEPTIRLESSNKTLNVRTNTTINQPENTQTVQNAVPLTTVSKDNLGF